MKNITNQTILITGATDGLGRQVAEELAKQGATVLLHGRNQDRLDTVLQEIHQATKNEKLQSYRADYASLKEVRHMADQVKADHKRLDTLVNNAGMGIGTQDNNSRQLSQDGYELRFAVNYLAPFLLTHQLLDLITHSAPARIINVVSEGQAAIDFEDVMLEKTYDGVRAYSQSKLAEIMFTFDLAAALSDRQVTVNCLHPATLMPTKMTVEAFGSGMASVKEGVGATMHLITDPALDDTTGQYFDGKQEARAHAQAYDMQARQKLRELSEQLTKEES